MANCLVGAHVGEQEVERLFLLTNAAEVKTDLARLFQLQPLDTARDRALLDLHFFNVAFAKERRFTGRQASAFLSIACELVFEDQQSPFRRSADSFARFKELLFRHTVQSPPESEAIFPREDAAAILDHMLGSYYRHFRLYNHVLTLEVKATLVQVSAGMTEEPARPRPLAEAVPM